MIPLRLTLKNFLSYGPSEQTINFEPYSLMCLSGKNGHGKSAILDAITWAIWGCARKMLGVSKGDDGLVHLGQKEMIIHLDFIAGGQKYRIRREFFKSYGKPVTRLDVELFDANLDQYITLTDKSIRTTQEKIEVIVGVDFATFVSTSFLRQGQSNEFSKKTPRERKEIIASIIGLATFDQRSAAALEKSKEVGQKIIQVQFTLEQAGRIAGELVGIEVDTASVVGQTKECDERLALLGKDVEIWGLKAQKAERVLNDISRTEHEIDALASSERNLLQVLSSSVATWRELHSKIITLPPVETLLSERATLVSALDAFVGTERIVQESSALHEVVQKEIEALQIELKHEFQLQRVELLRKKNELLTTQKYLLTNMSDASKRYEYLDAQLKEIMQARIQAINKLATRADVELSYDQGKRLFEKRRSFYHACASKRSMAQAALEEITERSAIVGSVESPACPLCEQLLTLKRKQFLMQQLRRQERLASHRLARATSVLKHLEDALRAQRSALEVEARLCSSFQSFEQDLIRANRDVLSIEEELAVLKNACANFTQQLADVDNVLAALEDEVRRSDMQLEKALSTDARIVKRIVRLQEIAAQRAAVVYDGAEHQRAKNKLIKLDALLGDVRQRATLFEEGVRMRHAVRQCVADIRRVRRESASKKEAHQSSRALFDLCKGAAEKLHELEVCRLAMAEQRDACSRAFGSLVARKQQSLQAQLQRDAATQEIDALLQEKKEYELLVEAYGKNGIQALLIEEVLPEVEHEANALLARLTDNQMQIFIESLRDLKSGGVRETLDIQISDGVGVRPYEMFSGGEAFRIDFALRIAVSKLLARRAGTHLQTLFIDEGFGSQDEEGLSRLTKALFAVQCDFEKIIVVSHLERLKENFPVHIVVEKRSSGSVVHVEERG